jgi:hypothetical protein
MKNTTVLTDAHNQWASRPADQRFQTLTELQANVAARRERSFSFNESIVELDVKVIVDSSGAEAIDRLVVNGKRAPMEFTNWSFQQTCGLAKASAGYLRTLPKQLTAQCLDYSVKHAQREGMKVMAIRSEDGITNTLQAMTSQTYGRIWDADVVAAASRIVERSNGRFHNPLAYPKGQFGNASAAVPSGLYASDRDVFIFMIDGGSFLEVSGNNDRDKLHRGFFLQNSEVGARTFTLTTFLHRGVCGNHFVWGAEDVTKIVMKHTSGAPARFDREAMPALLDYVNASTKPVEDAIRRAREMQLTKLMNVEKLDDQFVAGFAKRFAFTKGEVRDAIDTAKREEGDCASLWDITNGFTAMARDYEFVDSRIDLETRAGKLLDVVKNN